MTATSKNIVSVSFEVFGLVQGVFFRKYTEKTARSLNLVGYVKNTRTNTVVGVVQGPPDGVDRMKKWLQTEGSPHSRIDRCEFKSEVQLDSLQYRAFSIQR